MKIKAKKQFTPICLSKHVKLELRKTRKVFMTHRRRGMGQSSSKQQPQQQRRASQQKQQPQPQPKKSPEETMRESIAKIENEINEIVQKVNNLIQQHSNESTTTDSVDNETQLDENKYITECKRNAEYLTQKLIRLDSIDVQENNDLRNYRKQQIHTIQDTLHKLDNEIANSNKKNNERNENTVNNESNNNNTNSENVTQ
jgi:ribosomal protein L16 Arg81 hydroxylase